MKNFGKGGCGENKRPLSKGKKDFLCVFHKGEHCMIFTPQEILLASSFFGGCMQGKVEVSGVNTAQLKVLSQEQMDRLLLQAKNGDNSARQALVEGNLRLVLSVIQRFDKRGECADDLFQVGCIGLMKAVANFDPTKGVRFSTYGVPMVIECRNPRKDFYSYD